jgi:2-aminoadipate transaminase
MPPSTDLPQGVSAGTISLALGHPDRAALPVEALAAAAQSALSGPHRYTALEYGPEPGTPRLVEALIRRFEDVEHLALTPENLMLVTGATAGVDTSARLFARSGQVALVESPSYRDALHVLRDQGLDLVGVPLDGEGIAVDALADAFARLHAEGRPPALLYTIPTFQNPSGVTATRARREAVIALARGYNCLIVEDDVYRDLSFGEAVPPSYYALAGGEGVIRVGSFAKTLAPGLRLGWLIASPDDVACCANCGVNVMGGGANPFAAHVVADYIAGGGWDDYITRLCDLYRERCDVALAALARHMPPGVSWTEPGGGFFLWLTLPDNVRVTPLADAARRKGVTFSAGRGFFADPAMGEHNLRLAFSFAPPPDLERGIALLAGAIREVESASRG